MLNRILTVLLIVILSSCSQAPQQPEQPVFIDPAKKAKLLEKQGNYQQAAQEYLQIAAQSSPPTKQGHQVSAIRTFLKANMVEKAKAELDKLESKHGYGLEIPLALINVQIDLARKRIESALATLNGIEPNALNPSLRLEYKQLHAQVLASNGNVLEAIYEWNEIGKLTNFDPIILKLNHQHLWNSLNNVDLNKLQKIKSPENVATGWLELAILSKTSHQERVQKDISNWQQRFPNHPASQHIVSQVIQQLDTVSIRPKQIALLLPSVEDRFGKPAEAVKNGFLEAAKIKQKYQKPKITIYNVNSNNLLTEYKKAVDAGAEIVIGPLLKNNIEILTENKLTVPTLALNHVVGTENTKNLYQLALSPEDETLEVVKRVWADGHRSAMVLVPDGSWGERILEVFSSEWKKLGGQLVQHIYGQNFTHSVRKKLRKYKKVDTVFMVAPQHARQFVPLIVSQLGNKVPIYSISRVYSGTPNSELDKDLNGVIFVDMPWVLMPNENAVQIQMALQNQLEKNSKFKRLYALGVDAYNIGVQLRYLEKQQWQGQTGKLFLDKDGVIHRRQLPWAHFVNGFPHLLD
ncbi:penicillin-binding protein activator [Candidatus Halobeggiatoa sp. HSG11]|nr:penicillin-binding protein activator [Candidatus Halobeggiatoa sp. HSG11]